MAIVVGTNSFVTIAEADEYLETKNEATNWFRLNDNPPIKGETSKESFLSESFYRLVYNVNYSLTEAVTNSVVKKAQIEFALFLLDNYDDYTSREAKISAGIKSFTYSKWKETLSGGVKMPYIVEAMLQKSGYASANFIEDITVD